jgi:para-nitrobenzyl esterase
MTAVASEYVIVSPPAGSVRGAYDGATSRFLGIPYAQPPVGPLRFRAPQPLQPWVGVRDALAFGDAAPQGLTKVIKLPADVTLSEDCLTLNVWVPESALRDNRPRPVLFWVHGGAYYVGSCAQPAYTGKFLAEAGDVIVITVGYRLGALGWLDFTSLSDPTDPFEANVGLRDIILALEWVQQNISTFGGDPTNVTIFGQSAGGGCVTTLMTVPAAEGLFAKAIAESSPVTSVYKPERAARVAQAYLDIIGVSAEQAPQGLREIDATALAASNSKLLDHVARTTPGTIAFAPVVDGDLVPGYPVDIFRAGTQHKIPMIIGTNRDEASLFKMMKSPLMPISESTIGEMFTLVAKDNPALKDAAEHIAPAYPDFPKPKGAMEISRDAGFRMPSIWAAEAHAAVAPTWMYRFDEAPPLMKLLRIGATHAAEVPYVFGSLTLRENRKSVQFRLGGFTEALEISRRMQARWLNFARSGDPESTKESGRELLWPQYDLDARATLIIDTCDIVAHDPDGEIRDAWGEEVLGFK